MKDIIKKMCAPKGVSGYENDVAAVFADTVLPLCDSVHRDNLGNVIAIKTSNRQNAPKILIEAHMDKIGLMVKHITSDGLILFSKIGGIDDKVIPTEKVKIFGKETVTGVIGTIPPHVKKDDDDLIDAEKMCIDTGLCEKELKKYVSVGDTIEFDTEFTELMGDFIAASACDDRAGLAVLLETMKDINKADIGADVYAVAAVQEEVGLRGAAAAVNEIRPDTTICVDVCHAITPDNSYCAYKAGGGTVITTGPNVNPAIYKKLVKCANRHLIDYQIDADGGNTGTDAWKMQTAGGANVSALLSVPLRYMHTPYEVMSIKDAYDTAHLITEFIKEGDFDFCF